MTLVVLAAGMGSRYGKYSFEENVELTKKVVEYAHPRGVVVEAELGKLAGIEDDVNVKEEDAKFTSPDEAVKFVSLLQYTTEQVTGKVRVSYRLSTTYKYSVT